MVIKAALLFLSAMMVMGCSIPRPQGFLFNITTEPYSQDFQDTPVGEQCVILNSDMVEDPFGYVHGEWDNGKIIQFAQEQGITELHYIDVWTLNILGLYRRQTLIVYGD